eukprot:UN27582
METIIDNMDGHPSMDCTDHCAATPCQNGASCEDVYGGVQCTCTEGWQGYLCDERIPCVDGESFSSDGVYPCETCHTCNEDTEHEIASCTVTSDTQCAAFCEEAVTFSTEGTGWAPCQECKICDKNTQAHIQDCSLTENTVC